MRAVLHIAGGMGYRLNVCGHLTRIARGIDEVVGRHLDRVHIDGAGHRGKGSRAFAQFVGAGDVYLVGRVVLQALDGIPIAFDAFDLGKFALTLHTVVQVVGVM